MTYIFRALFNSFKDLFRLGVFWIMIWPILLASVAWMILGLIFWDFFSQRVTEYVSILNFDWIQSLQTEQVTFAIQIGLYLVLFVLFVIATSLVLTAIFTVPALVNLVAHRYYPKLEYKRGGNIVGSAGNATLAIVVFISIWVITIPLWVVGLGYFVPFVAAAYLNQQLFRYEVLSEHANHEELKILLVKDRISLWAMGLLTGLLQFIPVVNFFAPVLTALAFVHFELARLSQLRADEVKKADKIILV